MLVICCVCWLFWLFISCVLVSLRKNLCIFGAFHLPLLPFGLRPSSASPYPSLTPPLTTDCGSSLYTELEVMPDAVCVKAGSIDDKAARDFKQTGVEFYTKDRMGFCKAVEGAEQKEVFG